MCVYQEYVKGSFVGIEKCSAVDERAKDRARPKGMPTNFALPNKPEIWDKKSWVWVLNRMRKVRLNIEK